MVGVLWVDWLCGWYCVLVLIAATFEFLVCCGGVWWFCGCLLCECFLKGLFVVRVVVCLLIMCCIACCSVMGLGVGCWLMYCDYGFGCLWFGVDDACVFPGLVLVFGFVCGFGRLLVICVGLNCCLWFVVCISLASLAAFGFGCLRFYAWGGWLVFPLWMADGSVVG